MSRPDLAPATTHSSENLVSADILKRGRIKSALREIDSIIRDIDLFQKLGLNDLEKELLRGLMAYEWLRKSSYDSDRMLYDPLMKISADRFSLLRFFMKRL